MNLPSRLLFGALFLSLTALGTPAFAQGTHDGRPQSGSWRPAVVSRPAPQASRHNEWRERQREQERWRERQRRERFERERRQNSRHNGWSR